MNAHNVLAGAALAVIGVLAFVLVFFPVPQVNKDLIIYCLGALSGALTLSGANKIADKITNSNGPNALVQPDAETKP